MVFWRTLIHLAVSRRFTAHEANAKEAVKRWRKILTAASSVTDGTKACGVKFWSIKTIAEQIYIRCVSAALDVGPHGDYIVIIAILAPLPGSFHQPQKIRYLLFRACPRGRWILYAHASARHRMKETYDLRRAECQAHFARWGLSHYARYFYTPCSVWIVNGYYILRPKVCAMDDLVHRYTSSL